MLAAGARVVLPRQGGAWYVGAVLGEGGQGTVYELVPEAAGRRALALKWYRPEAIHPSQRAALVRLVARPAPSSAFLWPTELVDGEHGAFGYVMPLRPPESRPLADLLIGRVDVSFSTVTRLCMGLADAFLQLHAQGLCYRDISLGNVFFDVATGQPLICDNDNVGVDGEHAARVLGTARFMAPEIVRGEAQPSTATDLYSLAVLIFYVLMVHHPLQGRRELHFACLDQAAEQQLFGDQPVFVFDPIDDSNAPDPVVHPAVLRYWPLYPAYIRQEFIRAFTVGLANPQARVREGVWRSRLARLLDGITACACGRENFTDEGHAGQCWACGADLPEPVRLEFGGRSLVLRAGARLTRHHLRRDYDYAHVLGEVVAHPSRAGVWGLRNLSDATWAMTLSEGDASNDVPPGRAAGLVPGAVIDFGGGITARIVA
ncbi:MAG: hypothetical protein ABIM89_03875 [Mycobacteriales bacterium]